jgi:hypothetical protein
MQRENWVTVLAAPDETCSNLCSAQCVNTYILPIVTYALPVWFPHSTERGRATLNAVLTKFLKRCLGVPYPYGTYDSIVHFLCETIPLSHFLQFRTTKDFYNIAFPPSVQGVQFSPPTEIEDLNRYNVYEMIPSFFWMSVVPTNGQLPDNPFSRRALLYDMIDLFHCHICIDGQYHHPSQWCLCMFCGFQVHHYHHRTCE